MSRSILATSPRTPICRNLFCSLSPSDRTLLPQAYIERAFAAEAARSFRIAQHHVSQGWPGQPMRHGLPEHAPLFRLVEGPGRIGGGAFAGDDQHVTIALPLRRFEEAPQRRMRLALPHAVQVE